MFPVDTCNSIYLIIQLYIKIPLYQWASSQLFSTDLHFDMTDIKINKNSNNS